MANLAMLDLTDTELDAYRSQLDDILEHASDIEELDVHDVPPTHHPYHLVNIMRADDVTDADVRDAALAAAPSIEDDRFRVPPALGEEP